MMKKVMLLTGLVLAGAAKSEVVRIELPLETAVYKPAPGAQLANGQCLTCHSADYAGMQPPKGLEFWKAEVDKMRDKYGAPIPADQLEALAAYFAINYGTNTPGSAAANPASAAAPPQTGAIDAKALALRTGCLGCHNIDLKIVGPAYKDIAAKYRGKAEGLEKVQHQITHGGAGQWGQIPMPPFAQLTPDEVLALANWVLGQ